MWDETQKKPRGILHIGPNSAGLKGPRNGFQWVPADGWEYEVSAGKFAPAGEAGPWLVPVGDVSARIWPGTRRNDPFRGENREPDRVGLHRWFAWLADQNDRMRQAQILKLADRYGFLDRASKRLVHPSKSLPAIPAEPYAKWLKAMHQMAAIVEVWDHVRQQDAKSLEPFTHWSGPAKGETELESPGKRSWFMDLEEADHEQYRADWWSVGWSPSNHDRWSEVGRDPVEAAREAVYAVVERHLAGHIAPNLSQHSRKDVPFRPLTLRAELYLHFMRELGGQDRQAIQCANPGCGRFFIPTHGRQRHCSEQCRRLASYYRRTGSKT